MIRKIKATAFGLLIGFTMCAASVAVYKGIQKQKAINAECRMMLSSGYCVK